MTTATTGNTGPYLDQQLHVLVDLDTRAFTLGRAAQLAQGTGRPPREGDAVRQMLVEVIADCQTKARHEYREIMKLGHAEIDARTRAAERRRAGAANAG